MKILTILIIACCLSGCLSDSSTGSHTVEELHQEIRSAYVAGDGERIIALSYEEGTPTELKELGDRWLRDSRFGLGTATLDSCELHRFDEYTPSAQLPGSYKGKELSWCYPPTHWVVLKQSSTDGNSKSSSTMELAVGKNNSSWHIVGVK